MFTTHAFFFFFYVPFFPSGLFHNDYDTAAVDSCCFVVLRCTHARTRARADVETVLVIPSTQLTPSPLDLSGNRGGRHHHIYHYHPSNDEQHMCICARSRADSMNCHEGPQCIYRLGLRGGKVAPNPEKVMFVFSICLSQQSYR